MVIVMNTEHEASKLIDIHPAKKDPTIFWIHENKKISRARARV
jgi:hypothetical protein